MILTFIPPTRSPATPPPTAIPSTFLPPANGANAAFNVTYAVANSTSNSDARLGSTPTNGTLTPVGSAEYTFFVNSTGNGGVLGQQINYTLPILTNSNVCTSCGKVFLDFAFFTPTGPGLRIDPGGFASVSLYNATSLITTIQNATSTISSRTMTASEKGLCPDPTKICYEVTNQIGKHLTLAFKFGWKFTSATAHVLSVQVGSVELTSPAFTTVDAHSMNISASTVTHSAAAASFNYNQSVWPRFALTLYYPTSYSGIAVTNTTGGPPLTSSGTSFCKASDCASFNVTALSLVFPSAPSKGSIQLAITAASPNTVTSVKTVVGGIVPTHWMPGETMGVNVTNSPSVSQPGTLTVTPGHTTGQTGTPSHFVTTTGGQFNVIAPTSPLGSWILTATFQSSYDYGTANTTITIEHLRLVSSAQPLLKVSGDNGLITVSGTINLEGYNLLTPSAGSNVGVFAVSTTTSGPNVKTYNPGSVGLYVSNTTYVNGAFTSASPLIMFVTITNPSSTQTLGNVTISHENAPGTSHGVNATFAIDAVDNPPLSAGSRTYEVDVTFNGGQMSLRVTSLQTGRGGVQLSVASKGRSAPVFGARQQFGLFNVTVASTPSAPGWVSGATVTRSSIETQPFAYVFTNSLISQGGRVLASGVTATDSSGAFTASFDSSAIFQGRHVSYIVLASDVNGIMLGNQDPTGVTDSPLLCGLAASPCQPNISAPTEATPGQGLNSDLKLRNNSTNLTMNLHITMNIFSGNNLLTSQSKPVTIGPGEIKDVPFTFNAPSSLGSYTIEFSSPEYGAPIYTSTLNVLLIPSWLQIAIPALIGVAIALVAIVYRARKPPAAKEQAPAEKTKPAPGKAGPRNP